MRKVIQEREKGPETALQASRRPDSRRLTHQQPEVEGAAVNEQPFEDVLVTAKMSAPHPSGSVEVGEGSLCAFAAQVVQALASSPSISPTIGVDRPAPVGVAAPLPPTTVGLGYVRAQPRIFQIEENRGAVVALVRYHFLQTTGMTGSDPLLQR